MKSPLGQYSETVAAGVAVCVILAAVLSRPLNFMDPFLDVLAGIAMGAIFGSTATANGVKAGQGVIIDKLDEASRAVEVKGIIDAQARRDHVGPVDVRVTEDQAPLDVTVVNPEDGPR